MARPKKNSKALNIRVDSSIYKSLEDFSIATKLTKTAIVELALEEYFKKNNKQNET